MKVPVIFLLLTGLLFSTSDVQAQKKKTNPRVTFVHPGAAKAITDVKEIFSMLSPAEQKQQGNLLDFLETFLVGVDKSQFIRVDLIFDTKGTRYLLNFPISNDKKFRANIADVGVESRKKGVLYQLKGEFEGWMGFKGGYAIISESAGDVQAALVPNAAVKKLLARKESLTFELFNDQQAAADQAARRQAFENTRKELLSVYKISASESQAAFAARQQAYVNQLDELERFFVEAARYVSGWKYDPAKKTGSLFFELDAIPGTSLDRTISEFAVQPSQYDGLPQNPASIFSGRINHPIDAMRKKAITSFLTKSLASIENRIDRSTKIGGAEKPSAKQLASLMVEMLVEGANGGLIDGFVEVVPVGSGHQIVGGLQTPSDMTKIATDAVKAWSGSRKGQTLTPNVDSQGDIKIHAMKLVINSPVLRNFIGSDQTIYLGIGPKSLWYAVGPNAQQQLKASITAAGKNVAANVKRTTETRTTAINGKEKLEVTLVKNAKVNPNALDVKVRMHPWMVLLDQFRSGQPVPTDREGKTQRMERDARRQRILSATKGGDDGMMFRMHLDGKQIKGRLDVMTGLIRFVGKEVAKFSKDNLDVDG